LTIGYTLRAGTHCVGLGSCPIREERNHSRAGLHASVSDFLKKSLMFHQVAALVSDSTFYQITLNSVKIILIQLFINKKRSS